MTKTMQTNSLEKLVCFYEEWQKKGDIEQSEKLLEVVRKYKEDQLMIAFCGHFSAGKSTMMNYLFKNQFCKDRKRTESRCRYFKIRTEIRV